MNFLFDIPFMSTLPNTVTVKFYNKTNEELTEQENIFTISGTKISGNYSKNVSRIVFGIPSFDSFVEIESVNTKTDIILEIMKRLKQIGTEQKLETIVNDNSEIIRKLTIYTDKTRDVVQETHTIRKDNATKTITETED